VPEPSIPDSRWAPRVFLPRLPGLLAGLVLFSGSLYVLSLTGQRWIGAITPFGGTAFLAGWLLFAVGVWKGLRS